MSAAFEFIADRKPDAVSFGPGGCRNLAPKGFRSIWGLVSGEGGTRFTAEEIQNGDIRSQDGKASIGGTPVLVNGKPHIKVYGKNTMQEFQIPEEAARQWDAYEGKQSLEMSARYLAAPLPANHSAPKDGVSMGHMEFTAENSTMQVEPTQFDPQAAAEKSAKKAPTEAQLAHYARMREAAAAKRAAS